MSRRQAIVAATAFVAAAGLGTVAAEASIAYRTVALTATDGQFGPGEGTGITFFSLTSGQPSINTAGQVAFRGQDSQTGNPNGLWLSSSTLNPAANAVVGINGGAMPGGGTYPTGSSATFNTYAVNNAGQVSWRLGAGSGAFSTTAGPGRAVYAGDFAPETTTSGPLATFGSISSGMPLFNQAGTTAVQASLVLNAALTPPVVGTAGSANATGFWIGTPGNMHLALRQNDTLSSLDASGNTRVNTPTASQLVLNGNGRYAVVTSLQGSNVITGTVANSNSVILATNRNGSFEAVARVGNAAPDASGAASSNLYRAFSSSIFGFNDAGHVVFSTSLRDAAGTQTATNALFTDAGTGTMHMVAKNGDALPTIYSRTGSPLSEYSGVTWNIFGATLLNSHDQALITASGLGNTGSSTNTSGLFLLDSTGQVDKVERDGDVAIPGGATDGSNVTFLSTSNYQLNGAGQAAFMSNLKGTGVSVGLGNGLSLWVADTDGTLIKIARASEQFQVGPGDIRTISNIGGLMTAGGQDGRAISLADNGDLAFQLDFSDGTGGIFVAHVPEPTSAIAALGGLFTLTVGRRQRRR